MPIFCGSRPFASKIYPKKNKQLFLYKKSIDFHFEINAFFINNQEITVPSL